LFFFPGDGDSGPFAAFIYPEGTLCGIQDFLTKPFRSDFFGVLFPAGYQILYVSLDLFFRIEPLDIPLIQ